MACHEAQATFSQFHCAAMLKRQVPTAYLSRTRSNYVRMLQLAMRFDACHRLCIIHSMHAARTFSPA
eukprot:6172132-Pleurochrysis_carterae.AAC.2